MKLKEAEAFCHRFGTGLHAGADMIQLLKAETKHGRPKNRQAMEQLMTGAQNGEQISKLMMANKFFPSVMTAMMRVGEETGRMERTLLMLAQHYRNQIELRRSFIKSITWPCLQLFGAIVVISIVIMLLGMLPVGDILGLGWKGGSGVIKFWGVLAVVFGSIYACYYAFTRNIAGVQNIIPFVYMIPKLGPAIQTITLARFTWTLALGLDAGLEPIRTIKLALDSTDSDYYRAGADDARDAILEGATLDGGLRATHIFPDDFLVRVETAELSGTSAEAMEYVAKEYDERAKTAIKTISGIISVIIWLAVVSFIIMMIVRIAMFIAVPYNEALEMLDERPN